MEEKNSLRSLKFCRMRSQFIIIAAIINPKQIMKRILTSLIVLMMSAGALHAQKVDLDKQFFTHKYRTWPNTVLDKAYKTYSVDIRKTVALDVYSNESANERVTIEGRKKVSAGGHIQIIVDLQDLITVSNKVAERTEPIKDQAGKETGKKTYYRVELNYTFAATSTINDYQGTKLNSYTLSARDNSKVWKSSEYDNYTSAAKFYNDNKLEIKTKLISDEINAALNSLNSSLAYEYGYSSSANTEILWKLGSKKHPEFDAYNTAIETTKASLEKLTADQLPADIMAGLESAIKYFESLPEKYNVADDKAMKKLRYGAFFNLTAIYLYTENFDKAKDYATKLVANDYDAKDGERFLKEIESIKAALAKHAATTRHFVPDFQDAQAPNK
jgi:hypothetical protein